MIQYISNPRCLLGDEDSKETRRIKPREANVESGAAALKCRNEYKKQQALQLFMLRKIRDGDELFVNYGIKY